jgi:hypothetical protein
MNDELHKLMEHAKEYASQNATGDWEVGPSYQDIFNKKFAELIVRECAEIADCNWRNACPGVYVREHFGVE